jgi:2-dehydro-3-deoxyphosphogluconate aldolase/(4S)-4-hydroxy-2-oxoglutarate aldolase
MTREEVRGIVEAIGIIPGVRVASADLALFAAESINEAGIPISEITMTVPGAIGVITRLASQYSDFVVGAGTVLDLETAKRCVDGGARFLTSPGLIPEVVDFALANGVTVIPGALTPSEVIAAWKTGADFVKIFPCAPVGGYRYVRALKVPLPHIPLIASGGVDQSTASKFILAGASALGIRAEIFPAEALQLRQANWIHELARRFLATVREARAQMKTEERNQRER